MGESSTETIHVNGAAEVMIAKTLRALLDRKEIDPEGRGLAVALNGSVVPRARWNDTALRAGDTVEIVQAKQGG